MLQLKRNNLFLLEIATIVALLFVQNCDKASSEVFNAVTFATDQVLGMLDRWAKLEEREPNDKFELILCKFAIHERIFTQETSDEEVEFLDNILVKMDALESRFNSTEYGMMGIAFREVLRQDTFFLPQKLKTGLKTDLSFKELAEHYLEVVDIGKPDGLLSDRCMGEIIHLSNNNCSLASDCLELFTSNSSAYGYRRTHQLISLYIFKHHECAKNYATDEVIEEMVRNKCSEVYREQQAIRALGLPKIFYDLFIEQNRVCGSMFGYEEFLNMRNILETSTLGYVGKCDCKNIYQLQPLHCLCHNHIDSLAFGFYISVLTYFM